MFQLTHKTLFRSLNIINVVKGRFFPKEEQTQYLFNLCTSFEIFAFDEKTRLQSKFFQHLFSKAFYMCIGPSIDGVDTFFAIRDTDVIHFQYSEVEDMFISANYFDLPKNSITPNFASYNDGLLIISCIHGGLCGFEIMKSEAQLSFSIKPCTSVLQSFPVYKNYFFRIETGPSLVYYNTRPFGLEDKRNYDEQTDKRIFYAFPFGQDGIVFCTQTDLKCSTTNSDSSISFPPNFAFDPIIDHTPIAPSDVLILTRKGGILRLRSDLSLSLIRPPEKNSKILKIFNLDMNHFLIVNKSIDHYVLQLSDKNEHKIIQFISSTVGLSNISICIPRLTPNEGSCVFAPQFYSFSDDNLIIYRQGRILTLYNEFELPDKPTGIFNFTYNGKEYVVVSFENGSKLLEINKDLDSKKSIIQVSSVPYYEDEKTIGIVTNRSTPEQEKSYQITPDQIAPIPFNNKLLNHGYPDKTVLVTSTKYLNIRITEKNVIFFTGKLMKKGTNEITSLHAHYDLKFTATFLTVSPPDSDGFAEFVVMGAQFQDPLNPQPEYSVVFQTISDDDPERENIINEKFPNKVCSIEFLDKIPDRQLGILIGLESGSLIVGEINFDKREIETKQIIQLGVSPCHIRAFKKTKTLIFGLSTRIWLLEPVFGKNLIRAHPFSVASPTYMTMDSDCRLFLTSGKIFSIYASNQRPTNPDYTILRKNFPSQIVSVKIVDFFKQTAQNKYLKILTPLLLVICKKEIYAIDSTCPIANEPIISYEDEIITGASYTNRTTFSKFTKEQKEYTYNSYLAITTFFKKKNPSSREYEFHCINVYKVEQDFIKANLSRSSEQKKNLRLLTPVLSEQFSHRIDAISITCCPTSLFNKLDKKDFYIAVASNNSILLYTHENKKLLLLTKIEHVGSKINHLYICLENHIKVSLISIYISDVQKSVSLIYYDLLQNIIIPFSEEGALRPISSELAPYRIEKKFFCGGDRLGNFFIFSPKSQFDILSAKNPMIKRSDSISDSRPNTSSNSNLAEKNTEVNKPVQRLWFFYNINVGDVITSVEPAIEYDINTPLPIWYSTIGGSIGCFLDTSSFKKTNHLMNILETEISMLIFSLTHCDSLTFRNRYYQSYSICDLDVVNIFTKLTPQRKEYIIKRLLEKNIAKELGLQPSNILEVLESEILKCSNLFWLWN